MIRWNTEGAMSHYLTIAKVNLENILQVYRRYKTNLAVAEKLSPWHLIIRMGRRKKYADYLGQNNKWKSQKTAITFSM